MPDDFDPSALRIALDQVKGIGMEREARWFESRIKNEEDRIERRQSAGRSILAETIRLAEISGPIRVPRDSSMIEAHVLIQSHPVVQSLRLWLGGTGRLLRGLVVQIIATPSTAGPNDVGFAMRVFVAESAFSTRGIWRPRSSTAHEAEAFERCHNELVAYLGPGVEIL
jgi:hypothetical protein